MLRRASLVAVLLVTAAQPAFAVKEWWELYQQATDEQIKSGHCTEAIQSLKEAIRLKPASGVNEQTYGLEFINYFPYYYLGVCYLRTGDINDALKMADIEEQRGAIKRSRLYKDLLKLRQDAHDAQNERVARQVREEAERLLREGAELAQRRHYDEALEQLAKAKALAASLDAAIQQRVSELADKVQAEKRAALQQAEQQKRLEEALAEGRRLLDEGKPTEAAIRFDEALAIEPRNVAATEGKEEARQRLLASQSREARAAAFERGKKLFDAGQCEAALKDLTDAAADAADKAARGLLLQAQKCVAGVHRAKEQHARIEKLLADADQLLAQGKYAAASVQLREVLDVDPENVKAKERVASAERMTTEEMLQRFFPDRYPELVIVEPEAPAEVEGPSVQVIGVATDDRGVARLEFRASGKLVATQLPPPPTEPGQAVRNLRFQSEFALEPGPNDITVTAFDSAGHASIKSLLLTRRLRWWETRAFLPSAFGTAVALVGAGLVAQRVRRRRAVRKRFNPYIAGAPVLSEDMFFGRAKLLTRILNVLHHNSLMITGERRIGKTTFLYHLKKALESEEQSDYRFFPVFTDLQGVPESAFFHAVMNDVVDTLRPSAETLASLRFRAEVDAYDGRDFSHDLQRVIEELKGRTPRKVKLALLIDEVDALNEYSERINQRLRGIFMKTFSEHLVAIMSGVGIKRSWTSEGSPWYNFFDEIELSAFSREEAEALIRSPVEGYFRYQAEAVERILAWSELKPYIIQKFCVHAVNRMLEEERTVVTAEDVQAVRETARFDELGSDGAGREGRDRAREGVVAD
jgi:tetratricopeptide (TPR) repeat protein